MQVSIGKEKEKNETELKNLNFRNSIDPLTYIDLINILIDFKKVNYFI